MSRDLLPANATPLERALAETTARLSDVAVPIRDLWSPENCPTELLPWLAWALSVDSRVVSTDPDFLDLCSDYSRHV